MWLTKNEKKVLKLLVDNAKLSDTSIAKELNISSQAVGKIRKKLEQEVIKKYTIELECPKLNINLCSLVKIRIETSDKELKEKIIEDIFACPNVIELFSLLGSNNEYIVIAGFTDLNDFENLMKETEDKKYENYKCIKTLTMYQIPCSKVLKNSKAKLYNKYIENLGNKHNKLKFNNQSNNNSCKF